jgi:hypothetical protein
VAEKVKGNVEANRGDGGCGRESHRTTETRQPDNLIGIYATLMRQYRHGILSLLIMARSLVKREAIIVFRPCIQLAFEP